MTLPGAHSMPYADCVRTASRPAATLLAAIAVAAAAVGACGTPPRTSPASPGSARGALPVELVTSPVVATREWRWNATQGLEIDTRNWVIRSSLRSTGLSGSLPAFYEAALRNYRSGLVPLPAPPRRLEACVFGTRDEWARYTEHRLGADAGP